MMIIEEKWQKKKKKTLTDLDIRFSMGVFCLFVYFSQRCVVRSIVANTAELLLLTN